MRVYHRTTSAAAAAIRAEGFRDATDTYMTTNEYTGVWFSDSPLGVNEGASGHVLLSLVVPEALFVEFEWVEDGKPYREALIPAALVNCYPILVETEE